MNDELDRDSASSYRHVIDSVRDRGDESVADLYADLGLALTEQHVERLRSVESALDRIKNDTYGICSSCGEGVDPERLEADPAVSRCFRCQSRVESTPSAKDVTPSL